MRTRQVWELLPTVRAWSADIPGDAHGGVQGGPAESPGFGAGGASASLGGQTASGRADAGAESAVRLWGACADPCCALQGPL